MPVNSWNSMFCFVGVHLQGLYRTTNNRRLSDFLSRDFSEPAHRQAAGKNAFVLLGQHRHTLAAAFFILGEPGYCLLCFLQAVLCLQAV